MGVYKIGVILLVGLLFNNIFSVFGTDAMFTVANFLVGPFNIPFPCSRVPDTITVRLETSLLGLGDIVIPGIFFALLLRFDAHVAKLLVFHTDCHVSFRYL